MAKKPICLIDYDDVVADCNEFVIKALNDKYNTNYTIKDLTNWGMTGDVILDKRFEFYANPEWVATQPVFDGAVEFINALQKRCEIVFCTAVHPDCMSIRAKEIYENFGIDASHVIMTSMKELVNSDFQLDDSPENIRKSISKHPVLFRRPWNYDVSGIMSISSYDEFLTFVDYILNPISFEKFEPNNIICLVGPSGSGKTEIINEVVKEKGFEKIPTYTTSGKTSYTNLSDEEFELRKRSGFFAETTVYAGQKYGISKETVSYMMTNVNTGFIFATDMCGAMALKNIFGKRVVVIFVKTEKITLYTNILRKKLPEKETVLRQISVDVEMNNKQFCDYVIYSAADLISNV